MKVVIIKKSRKTLSSRGRRAMDLMLTGQVTDTEAMRQAGYAEATINNPSKLTRSQAFIELLARRGLDDDTLIESHKALLNSSRIDHMVFPLAMTEEEIIELLATVNCPVKKFSHTEFGIHVWFWSADNQARAKGLELAYKAKAYIGPERLEGSVKITHELAAEDRARIDRIFEENK